MTIPNLSELISLNRKPIQEVIDHQMDDDTIDFNDTPWDSSLAIEDQQVDFKLPEIHGSANLKTQLTQLIYEYKDIFRHEVRNEPANVPPMELDVDDLKWKQSLNRKPPRVQSTLKQTEIRKQTEKMLSNNVIVTSQAPEFSQVLLAPKPNNKWRFCIDYRNLNDCTKSMGWPIPNIQLMLARIGQHKPNIFAIIDFTAGYHQAPLSENSKAYTAFITFMGVYEWKRVPFGLKGAPAYFQHMMATVVLAGLIYIILEVYLDDILIYATSESQFLDRLRLVFASLRKHKLTVNPDKCKFGLSQIEYVGHVIDGNGLSFSPTKIEKIINFRKPKIAKELKSFLGLASYFRDHVKNHSMIVRPLHSLITPYSPKQILPWNTICDTAYENICQAIINCPKLYFMHESAPVFLQTDASDYGIGAYLFQIVNDVEQPIAFISKALAREQLHWSTPEKEAYAIFYSFQKLEYLIRDVHFTLQTDHKNLTYIYSSGSAKVLRWKLAIQEYDFEIQHIPGDKNMVADCFSRLCTLPPPDKLNVMIDEFKIPTQYYKLLGKVHNSHVGHHGLERTLQKLLEISPPWQYMREHARKFIKSCPCCQKMSYIRIPIHTHPFTTASYSIMERINVDSIGPLPVDQYGNKYIIVFIDCFSRFVELYPVPDTSAKHAAKSFLNFVGRYGIPAQLLSDNGSQFVNELLTEFFKLIDTEHVRTLAYSKEENVLIKKFCVTYAQSSLIIISCQTGLIVYH
jgi:hypothetical protein